jgi:SAM-dependent methyltransferase
MKTVQASVQAQFGATAANYRTSQAHATGDDLRHLAECARDTAPQRALDVGCGAGHVAVTLAPHAEQVHALDITPPMLDQVRLLAAERGAGNIRPLRADVARIPALAGAYDLIASRYSAHHWPDPVAALAELSRVLRPGGRFLLIDIVGFEDHATDTLLGAIELLRDPSHVRDHTVATWQALLGAAGFTLAAIDTWRLRLDFDAWLLRMAVPAHRAAVIRELLDEATTAAQEALGWDGSTLLLPAARFIADKRPGPPA